LTAQVILITIFMFFLLVGIHEWGHYYFAKRAGILVREFAIGFGPKVFSYKKGETRYTFRLIPFGGYVRMAGEDPEVIQINSGQTIALKMENDKVKHLYLDQLDLRTNVIRGTVEHIDLERKLEVHLDVDGDFQTYTIDPQALIITKGKETQIAPYDRQFGSKTTGQRALTIFAGPFMNAVLAFVLFFTFVLMTGIPIENPTYLEVGNVQSGSAASEAGLKEEDIIIAVNGEKIGANSEKLVKTIQASPEKEMKWSIIRNEQPMELTVTPEKFEDGTGRVGIGIALPTRSPSAIEAIQETWSRTIFAGELIVRGLKMLVTLQLGWDDLGGPVRIVEFTGDAVSMGVETLISWAALLSLYLGIFNLLPFPALDGSRLVFIGLEAIRGKPVDPNRESLVHFIGFAMIMVLMVVVTYNDILRLFNG
jgi:regulator of sigma E protease